MDKKVKRNPDDTRMNNRRYQLIKLRTALDSVEKQMGQQEPIFRRQVEVNEDPFTDLYDRWRVLRPVYDFDKLYTVYAESDVLQSCVEAMQQNVDGFGFQLDFTGKDQVDRILPENQTTLNRLKTFFDAANETQSWITIRKLMREDLEVIGNGAFEVIRNRRNQVAMVYHIPFRNIRMTKLDLDFVTTTVTIPRDGKLTTMRVKKKFRRYVQLNKFDQNVRWFKEFGDKRVLDAIDGKFKDKASDCDMVASELWHFKLPFGGQTYGLPRWLGVSLDVMGRRMAAYVNYDLFQSQGIPPMAIMISGGVLTDDSIAELENMIRGMRGFTKWNRIALLEANPETVGIDDKGNVKMEMKNMTEFRKEDQMFDRYLKTTAANIRHRYRLPPLYTGAAETFCVSADTETLTENGWKKYWEVYSGEKIATFNPKSRCLEYQVPKDKKPYVFDFEGFMCYFKNKTVDMLTTPNHNMYLAKRSKAPWEKMPSSKIFEDKGVNYRVLFKMAPDAYSLPDIPNFSLPVVQKRTNKIKEYTRVAMQDILTLVGLYLGDGSVTKKDGSYGVTFEAKKCRKLNILKKVGERLGQIKGVTYSVCKKGRPGYEKVSLYGQGLHDWIADNCGTNYLEKKVPSEFMNLNTRQSELILEGLIATDGNVGTYVRNGLSLPNYCRFASTSKLLAEQAQLLAFKCGYRTAVTMSHDKRPNRNPVYYVNMTRKTTTQIHNFQSEQVPYSGKVYCFEVPNHLFVTRRNGKIGIHGNTHATAKSARSIAEEQVFVPERHTFDEGVNALLVRNEFKTESWLYRTKGPKISNPDEVSKGVETFAKAGAFSVNHAIERANESFGLQMSKYDEGWADLPITVVLKMLELQQLFIKVDGNVIQVPPIVPADGAAPHKGGHATALPNTGEPTALPNLPTKILKSDLWTDEEKDLYKKLTMIQHAVNSVKVKDKDSEL